MEKKRIEAEVIGKSERERKEDTCVPKGRVIRNAKKTSSRNVKNKAYEKLGSLVLKNHTSLGPLKWIVSINLL